MAAVGLGLDAVQSYIDRLTKESGKAGVTCVNSSQSVMISSHRDAVQEIEDLCKQDGVFARRLKVQQAYHSHHMDAFADAYLECLRIEMARSVVQSGKQHLQGGKQELKAVFSSAITGGRLTNIKGIASPDHWVGSLVQPVEFVEAFTEMALGDPDDSTCRSIDVLLDVGPHTALGGPIREILSLPEFEGIELQYWGCLYRPFLSLDFDPAHAAERWSLGGEVIISVIVQVLEEGFGRANTDVGPAEFEYAERDGILQIPQSYKDDHYNDMVTGPLVPRWG